MQSLDVIKNYAAQYRSKAIEHGRKPHVILMRDCVVGDSWGECVGKSNPTMHMHRFYFKNGAYILDRHLNNVKSSNDLTFDILSKKRFIAGSAAQCVEQIQMWNEVIQPDYLMLRMRQPGGPPQTEALSDIKRFADNIIPNIYIMFVNSSC